MIKVPKRTLRNVCLSNGSIEKLNNSNLSPSQDFSKTSCKPPPCAMPYKERNRMNHYAGTVILVKDMNWTIERFKF